LATLLTRDTSTSSLPSLGLAAEDSEPRIEAGDGGIFSARSDRFGSTFAVEREPMVFESPSADALAATPGPAAPAPQTPSPNAASHACATPSPEATNEPWGSDAARFRIRFRKSGDLRLVSHHDLMHVFERMLRRAELPVLYTKGFHPQPRMTFALSLALGVVGGAEVVELELDGGLSAEEVQRRLTRQAPPGLEILSARVIEGKAKLRVRRAFYRAPVPEDRRADVPRLVGEVLSASECWIERTRPERRRLNIRPFISELHASADGVDMALWITSHGAARPEEVLELLGLADLVAAGELILERTTLELMDEVPPEAPAPPAALPQPPRAAEPRHPGPTKQTKDTGLSQEAGKAASDRAAESAPRPTALISNPLEFDS
jgi:radical SAM-linked protein